jgi:outer membrane protein assembly factor BamD (BamD/ComL family)
MLAAAVTSVSTGTPQQAKSKGTESQRPDKLLYDSAVQDIGKKRFERGRLTLQTLINTYDSSELLPKAHLAIAESWYAEGGAKNFVQAHDECRLLIGAYPGTPEAEAAGEMLHKIEVAQGKQGTPAPR